MHPDPNLWCSSPCWDQGLLVNPSNSCNNVFIFGVGKGFLLTFCLLPKNWLKSIQSCSSLVEWMMVQLTLMRVATQVLLSHTVSEFLSWWLLCVLWVSGKLCHGRGIPRSLVEKRQAWFSSDPGFHQTMAQISWATLVAYSFLWNWVVCSWL